jgi:hypothetical protein
MLLLMMVFLRINTLRNGGSTGRAHDYFIPALIIGSILGNTKSKKLTCVALVAGVTALRFVVEATQNSSFSSIRTMNGGAMLSGILSSCSSSPALLC